VGAPLSAQKPGLLDALVSEALRNNPVLARERAAERRSEAELRDARGLQLPALTFDGRYSEQDGTLNLGDFVNPAYATLNQLTGSQQFPTNLDITLPLRHESRLRLVQPVFNEAIRRNRSVSQYRYEGQRWETRTEARRLAAQVQAAFLEASAARSAVAIWESSLELVRENERVAERLVAASQATPDVVFRARAERSEVEQSLAEARDGARAAGRVLNRLLGRPLETPVEPLPADSLLGLELAMPEDSVVASALSRREELRQVDAGVRAAGAAVGLATSSLLPSLSVALDYGWQGRDVEFNRQTDFMVASLVFSWNVFDGGRTLAARQRAQAEAERARFARRDVEDAVRLDVRQAWDAARVAQGAIGTAEARVAAARRSFELVRRKYEEGVASQIEFVDARSSLTRAELNRVLTIYRWGIRWVDLERAAALREMDGRRGS
jgi:outer membrane protein TolC